jgi:hypothetical protein
MQVMHEAELHKLAAGAGGAGTAILCREVNREQGKLMPVSIEALFRLLEPSSLRRSQ